MSWLMIVLILKAGVWSLAPQQYPTVFEDEAKCRYWAETIERGWKRVNNMTYAVACSPVYVSEGGDYE